MLVKICGIKSEDEITVLNKYLPDCAGFIFSKSKRYVEPHYAKKLIHQLDPTIKKVGVFVNENIDYLADVSMLCGLDAVQLHGEEDELYISELKCRLAESRKDADKIYIYKAVKVESQDKLFNKLEYYNNITSAIVLDSPGTGGSGCIFNWNYARNLGRKYTIVLAGGLNCSNLQEAVDIVKPYMVDVSSGVESNGYKDDNKVREFIKIAKSIAGGIYE